MSSVKDILISKEHVNVWFNLIGNLISSCTFFRFGEVSHYILNEQIAEYGKTFTVPKTSIYKPKMDQTLLRVVQAGLGKYIYDFSTDFGLKQ